jgi:hypothetical protein
MFGSRKKRVVVAVATRHPGALAALENAEDVEVREAMTTGGLYRVLPGAHLAVVDLGVLTETSVTRDQVSRLLQDMLCVSGADFAANPDEWLARARLASGLGLEVLPARVVALTSLSGGVGKTTLALSLARLLRSRGVPVAVAELTVGPSAFQALMTDGYFPHIYEVATQGKTWATWNGITVAPMDWRSAQLLSSDQAERVWRDLAASHVVTLFDVPAYHPFWAVVEKMSHAVLVVADPRPDSLANALFLSETTDGKARIVLNRSGLSARLMVEDPAAVVPDVGSDARGFPPSLARRLAPVIYPGWRA